MLNDLLNHTGPVAIVIHKQLRPVGGKGSVIFPPTYAPPEGSGQKSSGYNIDITPSGNRCTIDSVQSQANRLEAQFLDMPLAGYVPQIVIKAGDKRVNLLEAAHRLGDAAARFSELEPEVDKAFEEYLKTSNCELIARLNPMSLVFGVWDSRGTQAKISRIVRSEIYAENVIELSMSSQFVPSFTVEDVTDTSEEKLKKKEKEKWSRAGMAHVPAHGPGGVIVEGTIVHETIVNLVGLRKLKGKDDKTTRNLQEYILNLCLVCATMPQDYDLRSGCQLVQDGRQSLKAFTVDREGEQTPFDLENEKVLTRLKESSEAFGFKKNDSFDFDPEKAKKYIKKEV